MLRAAAASYWRVGASLPTRASGLGARRLAAGALQATLPPEKDRQAEERSWEPRRMTPDEARAENEEATRRPSSNAGATKEDWARDWGDAHVDVDTEQNANAAAATAPEQEGSSSERPGASTSATKSTSRGRKKAKVASSDDIGGE
eukprot:tig00020943_g16286.t1